MEFMSLQTVRMHLSPNLHEDESLRYYLSERAAGRPLGSPLTQGNLARKVFWGLPGMELSIELVQRRFNYPLWSKHSFALRSSRNYSSFCLALINALFHSRALLTPTPGQIETHHLASLVRDRLSI